MFHFFYLKTVQPVHMNCCVGQLLCRTVPLDASTTKMHGKLNHFAMSMKGICTGGWVSGGPHSFILISWLVCDRCVPFSFGFHLFLVLTLSVEMVFHFEGRRICCKHATLLSAFILKCVCGMKICFELQDDNCRMVKILRCEYVKNYRRRSVDIKTHQN